MMRLQFHPTDSLPTIILQRYRLRVYRRYTFAFHITLHSKEKSKHIMMAPMAPGFELTFFRLSLAYAAAVLAMRSGQAQPASAIICCALPDLSQ